MLTVDGEIFVVTKVSHEKNYSFAYANAYGKGY